MTRRRRDKTALIAGVVFIVLGFVFLLERLGIVDVPASFVIPILLVALGLGLILGRDHDDDVRPPSPPDRADVTEPVRTEEPAPIVEDTPPPRDAE